MIQPIVGWCWKKIMQCDWSEFGSDIDWKFFLPFDTFAQRRGVFLVVLVLVLVFVFL